MKKRKHITIMFELQFVLLSVVLFHSIFDQVVDTSTVHVSKHVHNRFLENVEQATYATNITRQPVTSRPFRISLIPLVANLIIAMGWRLYAARNWNLRLEEMETKYHIQFEKAKESLRRITNKLLAEEREMLIKCIQNKHACHERFELTNSYDASAEEIQSAFNSKITGLEKMSLTLGKHFERDRRLLLSTTKTPYLKVKDLEVQGNASPLAVIMFQCQRKTHYNRLPMQMKRPNKIIQANG
eukprot:Awhi_evm1s14965